MTDVQNQASGADPGNAAAAAGANASAGDQNNGGAQAGGTGNGDGGGQQSNVNGAAGGSASIAAGGESQQQQAKPYWPDDWRVKLAEHASAGDKKLYEKELKRLESMADPTQVYGSYRAIENTWASRNFIKKPGQDAKPEEIAEFQKALGWAEKPEDMLGGIKLENGAVIGDVDKPVLAGFLQSVHGATSAQDFINKATNWYFKGQEEQAAALDEADDTFRRESSTALKEMHGPAFKRKVNATASLFAATSGGPDAKNEKSFYARLLGGRTADGRIIGDDPEFNNWLISMAQEINPAMTVVEDGDQSGKSLDAEIREIEQVMRTDRRRYDKELAPRYAELIAAREKFRARQRA